MRVVIIGAGGQARVVYEIVSQDRNLELVAFIDNVVRGKDEHIMGIPVMGDHSVLPRLLQKGVRGAVVAVGDNNIRASHFDELKSMGLEMIGAMHPLSRIASSARLGHGVTVAMGATISTGARIGDNVIINTGAIVDHEDEIEDHVHIGPGCVLAGRVTIMKRAFVGIGSVIKEHITVGENSIIGAGSVVLENIPDNVIAAGTAAKVIRTR